MYLSQRRPENEKTTFRIKTYITRVVWPKGRGGGFKTFPKTLEFLGHTNRIIDVLKVSSKILFNDNFWLFISFHSFGDVLYFCRIGTDWLRRVWEVHGEGLDLTRNSTDSERASWCSFSECNTDIAMVRKTHGSNLILWIVQKRGLLDLQQGNYRDEPRAMFHEND